MKHLVSITIKNLAIGLVLSTSLNTIGWSQGDVTPIGRSNSSSHGQSAVLRTLWVEPLPIN